MRIAVLSRNFSRMGGGAESYAVALVQQLAARHDIHIFAQQTDQPVPGVTYHRVFRLCEKPRWINQLLYAIAAWWQTRRGFDLVHSHENTWHGQVQTVHVWPTRHNLFHGRQGVRLILAWLKVLTSPRLLTYIWLEGARFKPKTGRHVVAASDMLRDACLEAYPDTSVSVVTPGVQMPNQRLPKEEARAVLGLPAKLPLLLFVANDYARKGLDTLLQALTLLPAEVHLAVVGSRKPLPVYEAKAKSMGLGTRVHFLGPLSDMAPAYQAADVLVHPTLEDSYAMVVLEAMAHGIPVVVSGPTQCGISRELQDGYEALLLHDPRDVQALVRLLRSVLDQLGLADQLRHHGLAFAQTHTWESANLKYEALYQQAIALS